MNFRNKRRQVLGVLAAAGVVLALWAFVIEPGRLTISSHTITIPGWPHEFEGLKIVLVSDLHIGAPRVRADRLPEIVSLINSQQPDLILLAGDFVVGEEMGARFVPPETIAGGLKDLRARLGVFAALGNHDWWAGGPQVRKALEANGIRVLENESVPLENKGRRIWLVGLGDFYTHHTNLKAALEKIDTKEPVLAFTHTPDVFTQIPERIPLTMAGHTHGGQVWLPLLGRPIVPSAYGQRYATGLVQEGTRRLFVTNGVGTSILPVRFLVPPEVSVLTLTP
jgi:hypothetical protein